ncbi:MAG TPA: glycosyltransferase family 39 protein [Polyangiaceae bacterium]|nr:glycosyltransferase family 39 protein [Polyangiaceae bacterium]
MTDGAARSNRPWFAACVFLYGTVVAAFVAFVVYRKQGLVDGTVDLNGFGALARNIARGEGFSLGHGPTLRRGPLYPYFGAALLRVFGSDDQSLPDAVFYRPLIVANCMIIGLTCVVVWRLSRELFGARTALLAAIVCPLVPQTLRYTGMTEVETSMGLFTALLALTGLLFVRQPSIWTGAALGASAGAATLLKPIVLLFPVLFVPLACLYWWRSGALDRRAIVASGVALACFGALLVPWSLRNSAITGGQFRGISSNGPGEFLRGYVNAQPKYFLLRQDFGGGGPGEKWDPEANTFEEDFLRPYGIPFYRSGKDAAGNTVMIPTPPPSMISAQLELEKDRVEGAEVKRRVLHEPGAFLYKFAAQYASFWYVVETRKKSLIVGSIALIVLCFSGLGLWRARRERTLVWPVVSVVVYFNAIYAAFLAFARYSMPLYPTLTVLAAGGAMTVFDLVFQRGAHSKSPPRTPELS